MKTTQYLLCLYPRTWRERYEEEFLAMLEQRPISFRDGIDLFFGALDAHLHPELGTTGMSLYERIVHMFFTMRRSLLTIFCAFIGFVFAGWAFQKMTEYGGFVEAARTHSIIGLSFNLVVIGGVIAFLAVLIGGLPIAFAVVRTALAQKRRGPLFLLAVPSWLLGFSWGSRSFWKHSTVRATSLPFSIGAFFSGHSSQPPSSAQVRCALLSPVARSRSRSCALLSFRSSWQPSPWRSY